MGHQNDRGAPVRLLSLLRRPTWIATIQSELAALDPAVTLDTADDPQDAVARLAAPGHGYRHVLLEAAAAGDLLDTLLGLTAGADGTGIGLVLLASEHLPAIPGHQLADTGPGWLAVALAASLARRPDDSLAELAEIRHALATGAILARYQPIVRMTDRLPVGLEVLARLDHPDRHARAPGLFIPRAEAAGLGRELTEALLGRAFADWPGGSLGEHGLFMAVNMPLDVLLTPAALAALDERRGAAGIPAEAIVLELTESRPVERLEELRRATAWLRARNYGLAIDDVGPAIRDHRALLGLDFTLLKLDKDVVREAPHSAPARDFIAATVADARRSGLTVIAEGVETETIWELMASAGVDLAQGFLIARPLPVRAIIPWHRQWCAGVTSNEAS